MKRCVKKTSILYTLISLAIFVGLSFPQETLPYQALITELTGNVQIKNALSNEFHKALWGMQIFKGDRIKTENDAQVSLLFSNKSFITLGPNSNMTISDNALSGNNGYKSIKNVDSEMLADLSILSLQETINGEMGLLAGLRSDNNQQIEIIHPRNTKIMTLKPNLKWFSKNSFDQFKISLFDENGKLWTKEIAATSMKFPENEPPLNYGQSYFWYVEGVGLFENTKSQSLGFQIVSQEEVKRIEAQKAKIHSMFEDTQENDSYKFLLGSLYKNEGFFDEAISNFIKIAETNPTASVPHQILGNLYSQIGLKDKAISELKKAVELSQRRE